MNEHKMAFIIATNNEQYFDECNYYISRLIVPDGFETDVIGVREACSICEAYNAGMHSSDARYKVYLHHDVFILNQNFIQDVVDAFAMDPSVGMLGMIGAQNLPPDAFAFNSWDTGGTLLFNGVNGGISMYVNEEGINHVSAIDGMMMITNHDIEWREDVFDGWDFYDLSQSMEFWRAGYKIAIPHQKTPWCMHDLAQLGLTKYDHYRKIFCETYHDDFGFEAGIANSNPFKEEEDRNAEAAREITKLICRDLEHDRFMDAGRKLEYIKIFRAVQDNEIELLKELLTIYGEETEDGIRAFWTQGISFKEIREKYISLRFLLYRAQFDCPKEDYIPVLREGFNKGILSSASIRVAMNKYVYDQTKVYKKLLSEGIPAGKLEAHDGFVCPICGNKGKVLAYKCSNARVRKHHGYPWKAAAYTGEGKKQVYCAGCGASPEERAAADILQKIISGENLRVVALNYMPALGQWIGNNPKIAEFISSEKEFSGNEEESELQEFLGLDDKCADVVIASETFNHCADDISTMKELKRILKDDGYMIVINSMGIGITDTLEDKTIDGDERILHWQLFGGEKERRIYAVQEFVNRLLNSGLYVGKYVKDYVGKNIYRKLALPERFKAYICTKSADRMIGAPECRFSFDGRKKVSVILLTDGRADKLIGTINDIGKQIYPTWEILIVADKLNDEEKNVLSSFADDRVRVIETNDVRKTFRRNMGIKMTDGEYILFTQSGDLFEKDFMYKNVKLLQMDSNCVYSYADTLLSEKGMGISLTCPDESKSRVETSCECFDDMLVSQYPKLSSVIIRRSAVMNAGAFDEGLGNTGEREFLLRSVFGREAAEVPQVLVTVEVDREDPFEDVEDRVNEMLQIISEFKVSSRNPEAYVRNVSAVLTEVSGYYGEARERLVEKIYGAVKSDGFFDETDMTAIREELKI